MTVRARSRAWSPQLPDHLITTKGKESYEASPVHQNSLPEFDYIRMVVDLSVWQRRTTHMEARLDLYCSVSWGFLRKQSSNQEAKSRLTGASPKSDTHG